MKKAQLTDEQMRQFLLNVEEYKNSDSRVSLQNDIDKLDDDWAEGLIDTMSSIVKGRKFDSIFKKNMDAAQKMRDILDFSLRAELCICGVKDEDVNRIIDIMKLKSSAISILILSSMYESMTTTMKQAKKARNRGL